MSRDASEKITLIRYRMERAEETLQDARMLYKQNGTPASVVNRTYYSMFYAALASLASIDQGSSKHSGVVALFDQHFIKTKLFPNEMGKFLHYAFDMRQTGDYEEDAEISMEQAGQVLESAAQFVNSIKEKLSNQL